MQEKIFEKKKLVAHPGQSFMSFHNYMTFYNDLGYFWYSDVPVSKIYEEKNYDPILFFAPYLLQVLK